MISKLVNDKNLYLVACVKLNILQVKTLIMYFFTLSRNGQLQDAASWVSHRTPSPPPHFIKWESFKRYSKTNSDWIESGSFEGKTTTYLSKNYRKVWTIEPSEEIFSGTSHKLKNLQNVVFINDISTNAIPRILKQNDFDVVNFYLDGHFSDLNTFENSTPIREELEIIRKNLLSFRQCTIFVDDVRCFGSTRNEFSDYPNLEYLIAWAKTQGFEWIIEHDMFIMTTC